MMKNRFGKGGKHQKLTEDPAQSVEPLLEGVTFYVKSLGMCLVEKPNDEQTTADAVKKLVSQAKSQNKVRKVSLTITPKGIDQLDLNTKQDLESISIYRISYCTADKNHDKVFGFIARNLQNETLECHAFLCNKRKNAEELCLTVAQAFNLAFETECWDNKDNEDELGLGDDTSSSDKDRESPDDLTTYESGSPNKKSAPQAIPGVKPTTNGTSSTKSSPSPRTSLVSSGSAFSISPPPRHPKVVSSSAPSASSSHMIERHHNNNVRTGKLLDVPGHQGFTTNKYASDAGDATQLLEKWTISDDSNLDESFSKLAETRSNSGSLHKSDNMKTDSQANSPQHFIGTRSTEDLLCL